MQFFFNINRVGYFLFYIAKQWDELLRKVDGEEERRKVQGIEGFLGKSKRDGSGRQQKITYQSFWIEMRRIGRAACCIKIVKLVKENKEKTPWKFGNDAASRSLGADSCAKEVPSFLLLLLLLLQVYNYYQNIYRYNDILLQHTQREKEEEDKDDEEEQIFFLKDVADIKSVRKLLTSSGGKGKFNIIRNRLTC